MFLYLSTSKIAITHSRLTNPCLTSSFGWHGSAPGGPAGAVRSPRFRIREELRIGNSPQASIAAGYGKAFSTIFDANITTLIAALVLFVFGTGPIKGFAITLSIGIVTSMFTAIMGTRAIVNLTWGRRSLKKLSGCHVELEPYQEIILQIVKPGAPVGL